MSFFSKDRWFVPNLEEGAIGNGCDLLLTVIRIYELPKDTNTDWESWFHCRPRPTRTQTFHTLQQLIVALKCYTSMFLPLSSIAIRRARFRTNGDGVSSEIRYLMPHINACCCNLNQVRIKCILVQLTFIVRPNYYGACDKPVIWKGTDSCHAIMHGPKP